jgi:peptidoglycan/xylan/chitin deacetylase (PgdA/CDA1 family)
MRIWTFSLLAAAMLAAGAAHADVVTHLPTSQKLVALTFDACENFTPAYLDTKLRDELLARGVPWTMFAAGRFAKRNATALEELSKLPQVEIENHSMNHNNHMERMTDPVVAKEVEDDETVLEGITGRKPKFFRFPAGNYDARTLADVEKLGYKVVHWTFASGDPAKSVTPQKLTEWVLSKTRPGDILIFHINGRGWSTAQAMPAILDGLEARGYGFTRLDALIK